MAAGLVASPAAFVAYLVTCQSRRTRRPGSGAGPKPSGSVSARRENSMSARTDRRGRHETRELRPRVARFDLEAVLDLRRQRLVVVAETVTTSPPRRAFEARGRVQRHDLPVVDDRDAVAGLRLVHVVGREEDRHAFRRLAVTARTSTGRGATAGRGRRSARPGTAPWGSASARARSPAGVSCRRRTPARGRPRVRSGRHARARRRSARDVCARHAVDLAVKHEVLARGKAVIQGGVLKDDADLAAALSRLTRDVVPADDGVARRSGLSRVQSIEIVVVLPAPLGPRKPKISPRGTSNETPSTAVKSPNFLQSSVTSMALILLLSLAVCIGLCRYRVTRSE